MSADQFQGLWQGYSDNQSAPRAKNQPWYLYRNFRGPVSTVIPKPERKPQVYNRWTADPYTKAFFRGCNKWLFCNKKMRIFLMILTSFLTEKFWNKTLYGLVRYNNMECSMEYAYKKEREWAEQLEAERARRRALGLPEDPDDEEDEDDEDEDED